MVVVDDEIILKKETVGFDPGERIGLVFEVFSDDDEKEEADP